MKKGSGDRLRSEDFVCSGVSRSQTIPRIISSRTAQTKLSRQTDRHGLEWQHVRVNAQPRQPRSRLVRASLSFYHWHHSPKPMAGPLFHTNQPPRYNPVTATERCQARHGRSTYGAAVCMRSSGYPKAKRLPCMWC